MGRGKNILIDALIRAAEMVVKEVVQGLIFVPKKDNDATCFSIFALQI